LSDPGIRSLGYFLFRYIVVVAKYNLTFGAFTLLMTDVVVTDNTHEGILIAPSGGASVTGVIRRATLSDDQSAGTIVDGGSTTGNVDMTIVDTAALGHGRLGAGFQATSASGAANTSVYFNNVTINEFSVGVLATNEAIVRMTRLGITRNTTGVNDSGLTSPGAVYTFGDNDIAGNVTADVSGALTPVSPM